MTDKIERPDIKTRLDREYFADQARIVAPDLLGRTIVRQFPEDRQVLAKIKEVSAWQGATDRTADTAKYAPGMIGVSRKFGHYMIDIATGREDSASCVTIIAVEGDDGIVQGPGNVSNYLHIDDMFDSAPIDHPCFWIGGEPIGKEKVLKRNKSGMPKNFRGQYYYK